MGKYCSTRTRVKPLLDQLQEKQYFLNALLSTVNKNIIINERIDSINYDKNEKAIPPSRRLLVYLINNYNILNQEALGNDDGTIKYFKRKKLFSGDYAAKQEALKLLEQVTIPQNAWYIFEGYTQPDIYIETKNYIVIGEAKRTERKLTTSTKWLKERDQLIRHIDSVVECEKKIVSFLIIDREVSQQYYKNELTNYTDLEYFRKNLPHRSDNEINEAKKSYIGFTYWDIFKEKYGILFPDFIVE